MALAPADLKRAAPWQSTGPKSWQEFNKLRQLEELGQPRVIATDGEKEWTNKLQFAGDGKDLIRIVKNNHGEALRLYDLAADKCLFELPQAEQPGSISAANASNSGDRIAFVGIQDKKAALEVWDIARGKRIIQRTGYLAPFEGLAFSPDGQQLAAGIPIEVTHNSSEPADFPITVTKSEIVIWDLTTGRELLRAFGKNEVDQGFLA